MAMRVPIFRQQALDHFTAPEPLDQLMRVVRPQHWLALATCAVLVGGVAWWQTHALATTASGQSEWFKSYLKQRVVTLQATERYIKGQANAPVTISEFVDFR